IDSRRASKFSSFSTVSKCLRRGAEQLWTSPRDASFSPRKHRCGDGPARRHEDSCYSGSTSLVDVVALVALEVDAEVERDVRDVLLAEDDLVLVLGLDLDAECQPLELLDQDPEGL